MPGSAAYIEKVDGPPGGQATQIPGVDGELANRASQDLVAVAKDSYQAHELEAEAFESQQRWEEATAEYRKILEREPKLAGIHYRLARNLLGEV